VHHLLIKNAKLIGEGIERQDVCDLLILNGKIVEIGTDLSVDATIKMVDLKGKYYVSAGWIDAHTHCFPASPMYHDEPDLAGVLTGVTTVIDAGSVGADDLASFHGFAEKAKTNVFAFINISRIGLMVQNELCNMDDIHTEALLAAYQRYPNFIVGLKARMSKSVVGENGIQPLYRAKSMQTEVKQATQAALPLMVHIGNDPPRLDEIADLLEQGDIITHCFNGKPNKILAEDGQLKPAIQAALARGVILDVGHGSASFSFSVAEHSMKVLKLLPDMISSDIYYRNRVNGPVYDLATVMTKFLSLSLSLETVIAAVTSQPAQILKLHQKGHLKANFDGDLTIFELKNEAIELVDADKVCKIHPQQIIPVAAVVAGEWILTTKGAQYHDFIATEPA
jgi:dihydroorotase